MPAQGEVEPAHKSAEHSEHGQGKVSGKKGRGGAKKPKTAQLRGPGVALKKITDKKLKGRLKHSERLFQESQAKASKVTEWLQPSEPGYLEAEGVEQTWNVKQTDIAAAVDVGVAQKAFDLRLPELGPYSVDFTRAGRHLLLGGRKGHLAMVDWQRRSVQCEVQVQETTRDVCFLHNETFFAAAQKKYAFIYDKRGIEIHCLRDHTEPNVLQFLPHHFLLASVGKSGFLHYQDTSTGHIVATHRTGLGPCAVMRQNPWNAVLGLGHAGGVVTMWTPNITTPVVKMLSHRGPVNAVAFDPSGHYMASAGADNQIKVWDVRTFKPLHAYFSYSPVTSLDISQRGLLAVGYGSKVQSPSSAKLHSAGSGEPNFDSFVANPYASLRERREGEVAALLDKLQPTTIVLDPNTIGRVRKEPQEVQRQRQAEAQAANAARLAAQKAESVSKHKMKGKNKPSKRHRKKQNNIIEEKKPQIKAQKKELEQKAAKKAAASPPPDVPRALERFFRK
ncbi:WD40-repeat-containing domain protein [Dunaliella salina]|uniref:WD40-repeat-containing domain protein n=1 Tax=Dunaliella salina TaxID=3046 RepID=A0ABQ7GJ93_DUNSA|nr:WD40-repeat-containing domain protein [Dunaliella salina]|eukprot:KAF5834675.1 WD40-repeat-containing domain protein [Dunaliella salina]